MIQFCSLSFVILLTIPLLIESKPMRRCEEPGNTENIKTEDFIDTTKAQSYSITPGWFETMSISENVPSKFIDISYRHYLGNTKCKKLKKGGSSYDNTLNNLSTCMWRYVENIDKNRKPETLLEVECLCQQPVGSKKKRKMFCQSVIEYINVFRRVGCSNGVYEYERVWEPRSVACVASTLPEPKRLYMVDRKTTV